MGRIRHADRTAGAVIGDRTLVHRRVTRTNAAHHEFFRNLLEFAHRLHQAGVPLMIGTDGHGGTPAYARELDLHVQAGIPVWDVLRLCTSQGARLVDLGDRTGRFEVGLEADIVFLNSDPFQDITNVKDVDLVVTNGNAHSFEELTGDVAEHAN